MTGPRGMEAIEQLRRIECSAAPGAHTLFHFVGEAFARRSGEPDRLLFGVEGMLIRSAESLDDPQRGAGFARLGREMMIFSDPATGEPLAEWDNPITGETVEVVQVANDRVNARYFERDADGRPFTFPLQRTGAHWSYRQMLPIRRANPLGAGYDAEIGASYHAAELFAFFGRVAELDDPDCASVEVAVAWTRLSDWFPWMRMSGREGLMFIHTTGAKLGGWDMLPPRLATTIDRDFPAFRRPPPASATAPMDTSWTQYRAIRETGEYWYKDDK